jgi:hypothetical protein
MITISSCEVQLQLIKPPKIGIRRNMIPTHLSTLIGIGPIMEDKAIEANEKKSRMKIVENHLAIRLRYLVSTMLF